MGNLYIFGQKNTSFLYLPIDLGLQKKKNTPDKKNLSCPFYRHNFHLVHTNFFSVASGEYPKFLCPAVFTAFPCSAAHELLFHLISSAKAILGSYHEHPLLGQKCSPLLTFPLKFFRPCEIREEFSPLT